jgi:CelD/BcsL family acetyltransferase involved in cellulose biosynthesis
MRLDTLDAEAPGLADMLEGLRSAGIAIGAYWHFGNWRQGLAGLDGWEGYLAARPAALRNTIRRKLRRAGGALRFELVQAAGPVLEEAIAAYVAVRARSWKPGEPFPHFDAALLRAAAPLGMLRMGVLRREDGLAVAAQYWLLAGGRAALLKLAHDEACRAESPGTVLTALMIRHLIEVDQAQELDFGRGDDAYKALWATERRQRIGLTLSDRWHPAGLVEWARHCVSRGQARLSGAMAR